MIVVASFASRADVSVIKIHNTEYFAICFHYVYWLLYTLSDLFSKSSEQEES